MELKEYYLNIINKISYFIGRKNTEELKNEIKHVVRESLLDLYSQNYINKIPPLNVQICTLSGKLFITLNNNLFEEWIIYNYIKN